MGDYPSPMVDHIRTLLLPCLCVFGLISSSNAEPVLPANADALVKEGIKAYDAEDYLRAKEILLPLAEAGLPEAMNKIGIMLRFGEGFIQNFEAGCDWYEKSAALGNVSGMYKLSICYNHGRGREKDHEQMLKWRTQAALGGSTLAMINLAALDPSEGEEYLKWMLMAQEHGSTFAKVDLWLQGYKSESQMNWSEFLCVSWKVLIMGNGKKTCD